MNAQGIPDLCITQSLMIPIFLWFSEQPEHFH